MMDEQTVARIMTPSPVTVTADATLEEAARRMLDANIGSVLVVDGEDRLIGIVTESDFCTREVGIPFSTFRAPQLLGRWIDQDDLERIYSEGRAIPVRDIMSSPVYTVPEEGTLADVLATMHGRRVEQIPVVREGRPIGIVARHDLLKLMLDRVAPATR